MKTYTTIKTQLLKNPTIRQAYEALGAEFELVEQIIAKRIEQGLTQAALAKKIGTKQSAISRLETGTYNPFVAFLEKVAKALDTQLKISLL